MVTELVIGGVVHFELWKSFQSPHVEQAGDRNWRRESILCRRHGGPCLDCDSMCSPGTGDNYLNELTVR